MRYAIGVSAALGLIGPAIRLAIRPSEFSVVYVVQSITALIWPAQILGAAYAPEGEALATAGLVGINVILFGIIGAVAFSVRERPWLMLMLQCVVLVLVTSFSYLLRATHVWWALLTAVVIYSIPFQLARAARLRRKLGGSTDPVVRA